MNQYILKDIHYFVKRLPEFRYLYHLKQYRSNEGNLERIYKEKQEIDSEIWNLKDQIWKLEKKKTLKEKEYENYWIQRTKLWEKGFCNKSCLGHKDEYLDGCEYCRYDPLNTQYNYLNDDYYYDTYVGDELDYR